VLFRTTPFEPMKLNPAAAFCSTTTFSNSMRFPNARTAATWFSGVA
jgi:hypothetical protein